MTSQEETDKKQELVEKAKALGIKNQHVCGIEKLEEKIAELETKAEPVRKKAPRMYVSGSRSQTRDAVVSQLEAENPGYKYILERANITPGELRAKDLESTGKYLKNDLICRLPIEEYNEWLIDRNETNARVMHSVYEEGDTPSFNAQVKKPKG